MSLLITPQSAATALVWSPPQDACRWRIVPNTRGWETCQHNHVKPPARVLKARARRAA